MDNGPVGSTPVQGNSPGGGLPNPQVTGTSWNGREAQHISVDNPGNLKDPESMQKADAFEMPQVVQETTEQEMEANQLDADDALDELSGEKTPVKEVVDQAMAHATEQLPRDATLSQEDPITLSTEQIQQAGSAIYASSQVAQSLSSYFPMKQQLGQAIWAKDCLVLVDPKSKMVTVGGIQNKNTKESAEEVASILDTAYSLPETSAESRELIEVCKMANRVAVLSPEENNIMVQNGEKLTPTMMDNMLKEVRSGVSQLFNSAPTVPATFLGGTKTNADEETVVFMDEVRNQDEIDLETCPDEKVPVLYFGHRGKLEAAGFSTQHDHKLQLTDQVTLNSGIILEYNFRGKRKRLIANNITCEPSMRKEMEQKIRKEIEEDPNIPPEQKDFLLKLIDDRQLILLTQEQMTFAKENAKKIVLNFKESLEKRLEEVQKKKEEEKSKEKVSELTQPAQNLQRVKTTHISLVSLIVDLAFLILQDMRRAERRSRKARVEAHRKEAEEIKEEKQVREEKAREMFEYILNEAIKFSRSQFEILTKIIKKEELEKTG